MLFTQQEINAVGSLLARLPMSPAEAMFATGFLQRLKAFCTPPKPEPDTLDDALDEEEVEVEKPVG